MPEEQAEAFDAGALSAARAASGDTYLEFLRRDSMSAGLYVLDVGAPDDQQPHQEDEVYVVLEGRATLNVAGQEHPVEPGSIVFVARTVPHRFHDVAERLVVLVLFAPAETV
jgi:mannose-6-phosphate isomerase-like protein (cupin superfamily)